MPGSVASAAFTASLLVLSSAPVIAQQPSPAPMQIKIDFTDAPRHLLHVSEQLPVAPGINTFFYPQWIPGMELPSGPIDNLTGLVFHTGSLDGPIIAWRRDLSDAYSFHVIVPNGVSTVAVSYDILEVASRANTTGTTHTSSHVVMLEPSEVVLYPSGKPVHDIPITASIHLPATWTAATALRVSNSAAPTLNGPDTTFQNVSVEQFVDSPIVAGDHCRQYPLAPEVHPVHTLDVCAEKAADLDLQPALLDHMNGLVRQATKLFGSHHYDHYDFLVADSEHLQGDSLEHAQGAGYVVRNLDVSDPGNQSTLGYLLPHEYTHSWCGKFRRPAGIATPNYNTPMQNDLIWFYEGLTQYLGDVLTARSGFLTADLTVKEFNYETFQSDQPGRRWRSIQDTADASAVFRGVDPNWGNWRLTQNYYQEGSLLWLEADVKIRELTHGAKSMDDFAALFLGSGTPGSPSRDTGPGIVPYSFDDVVDALNTVAPYDWRKFWETRLNALRSTPPSEGLHAAGYDFVDQDKMSSEESSFITPAHMADMYHSLGFMVMPDATLQDVWIGSPAYLVGLGPGDKLTAVNGKPYTAELLMAAVSEAKTSTAPIVLTAVREDESKTYEIQYHGGEKYAHLVRNSSPDILTTSILLPK